MKLFLLVALLLAANIASALGKETGGGDMCEDRIKLVRDDLSQWIQNGGPNGLTLPKGVTVSQYSNGMLDQIGKASIKCVGQGDPGYPVLVNGTPKVCRFDLTPSTSQIACDYEKFNATAEEGQYALVHHEYAGLAQIEVPDGDSSTYTISNQITGFLRNTISKRLAVKPISACAAPTGIWDCTEIKPFNIYFQKVTDADATLVALYAGGASIRTSDEKGCFLISNGKTFPCKVIDNSANGYSDDAEISAGVWVQFLNDQLQWSDTSSQQLFNKLLKGRTQPVTLNDKDDPAVPDLVSPDKTAIFTFSTQ